MQVWADNLLTVERQRWIIGHAAVTGGIDEDARAFLARFLEQQAQKIG